MADTIPDLWPPDIRADVVTPLAILRAQERSLEKKTKGLLKVRTATTNSENNIEHQLLISAPALRGYEEAILTVSHDHELVYPVIVRAAGFPGETANDQDAFLKLLGAVLHSHHVRSKIDSLLARSNEIREPNETPGKLATKI